MRFQVTKGVDGTIILVEGHHIVDGKYRHIAQQVEQDGKELAYYTDGVEVKREILKEVK